MKKIAIIGAGLSGLVAAQQLKSVALVTVFEKSRGPSGRLSTRDAQPYQFDHGAQYFTARSEAFREFLNPLITAGHVAEWNTDIFDLDNHRKGAAQKRVEGGPFYVAIPKMNQLGKALASGLTVRYSTRIISMDRSHDKWHLLNDNNKSDGGFDWVICAIPSTQCARILPESYRFMPDIKQQKMSGCFALMLGFKESLNLPWQALKVNNSAISWICVNSCKPDRPPGYSLLVHSSNSWAETHMDVDQQHVKNQLVEELETIIGWNISHFDHIALHRWRYANSEPRSLENTLLDSQMQLGACGDWCVEGKVEGAFNSAMRLALRLKALLCAYRRD